MFIFIIFINFKWNYIILYRLVNKFHVYEFRKLHKNNIEELDEEIFKGLEELETL